MPDFGPLFQSLFWKTKIQYFDLKFSITKCQCPKFRMVKVSRMYFYFQLPPRWRWRGLVPSTRLALTPWSPAASSSGCMTSTSLRGWMTSSTQVTNQRPLHSSFKSAQQKLVPSLGAWLNSLALNRFISISGKIVGFDSRFSSAVTSSVYSSSVTGYQEPVYIGSSGVDWSYHGQ